MSRRPPPGTRSHGCAGRRDEAAPDVRKNAGSGQEPMTRPARCRPASPTPPPGKGWGPRCPVRGQAVFHAAESSERRRPRLSGSDRLFTQPGLSRAISVSYTQARPANGYLILKTSAMKTTS